jgi:hypothetical protein
MPKRLPRMQFVLPAVIDPPRICVQIEIPDEPEHIAAFMGSIRNLGSAYNWQNDSAHTAKAVADVWRDVFDKFSLAKNRTCPTFPGIGADGGDEQLIRQNPDNPCELQTSIDGQTWCTFADLSLCLPAAAQPGDQTPQPPPGGGQACYNAEMAASNKWLLPTVVSSGDVLTLSDATGSGNDGTLSPWECPDGSTFFAGLCVPGTGGTSGGDPLNSVNHMRLLYNIDGTFYDAMAGPLTVPGGVTAAQVYVQVNDSDITDNAGSYRFKVCRTNNQAATWSHVFDLRITPTPWVQNNPDLGNPWAAGVGFSAGAAGSNRGVQIRAAMASRTVTSITIFFTMTSPAGTAEWDISITAPSNHLLGSGTPAAGDQSQTGTGTFTSTEMIVSAFSSVGSGNVGDSTIYKIIVNGQGIDPF